MGLDAVRSAEAPRAPSSPREGARRILANAFWMLPCAIALIEVASIGVTRARVPAPSDWAEAGEYIRSEWQDGDVAVVAPRWADPLMRRALGPQLSLPVAARSDLEPFARLWHVSIGGHRSPEAPARPPGFARAFGQVLVTRWALRPTPVLYDFVDHIEDARVEIHEQGVVRECRWTHGSRPSGGGLGAGPITPEDRALCDPSRSWLWVGETVEEDLSMRPRRCVWQHPAGTEPVRASYSNVPLGTSIVLSAGLWWEHERTMDGGPVRVALRLDGREVAHLIHSDGDGWKTLRVDVPNELRGRSATVDVDVSASAPHLRSLCWAASVWGEAPR